MLAACIAAAGYAVAVAASRTLSPDTVALVKALIVAPVLEELFFRGIVQARLRALRGLDGRPWVVIIITAILFGAAHGISATPLHAALVVAPAIAFGWVFEHTRSIALCAVLHSGANAAWIAFWSL